METFIEIIEGNTYVGGGGGWQEFSDDNFIERAWIDIVILLSESFYEENIHRPCMLSFNKEVFHFIFFKDSDLSGKLVGKYMVNGASKN